MGGAQLPSPEHAVPTNRHCSTNTRLRGLVARAFTPRRDDLRPAVQRLVNDAINRAAQRGRMKLIADLAYPLPVTIISRLLGVPADDHLRIQPWSRAQLCCSFEVSGLQPAGEQQRNCMVQSDLTAYFDSVTPFG